MIYLWRLNYANYSSEFGNTSENGPGSVTRFVLPENIQSLNTIYYCVNESHPWVLRARRIIPKLQPKIMIRHCTSQCAVKRRTERHWGNYSITYGQRHFFHVYGDIWMNFAMIARQYSLIWRFHVNDESDKGHDSQGPLAATSTDITAI